MLNDFIGNSQVGQCTTLGKNSDNVKTLLEMVFFMHKITAIDIIESARAVRPSTAWSIAFITQIKFT